jgi:hypothetical protein
MPRRTPGFAFPQCVLFPMAAYLLSGPAVGQAADRLQQARKVKEIAIRHLRKTRLPGADNAAESRKARAVPVRAGGRGATAEGDRT